MRRPPKPFVTEYRGGSRRASHQGTTPAVDLFKPDPAPTSSPWAPSTAGEPQEDSYEAALRAADALFAGARPTEAPPQPAIPPAATSSGETPKTELPKAEPPTTGRILRVLDEPPSAEMLELQRLEAEHAPKKRGRKPGSKNKPKIAALDDTPPVAPLASPPADDVALPAVPAATVTAALAARAIATGPRRSEPAAPGERYAWVRTRLKPGQQWKRRLPKVAW